jgi:hypothetical protein
MELLRFSTSTLASQLFCSSLACQAEALAKAGHPSLITSGKLLPFCFLLLTFCDRQDSEIHFARMTLCGQEMVIVSQLWQSALPGLSKVMASEENKLWTQPRLP